MRTRTTAIAGVMVMVMAASACAPPVAPYTMATAPRRTQLSTVSRIGLIVGSLGGITMVGALGAAAITDIRVGPNFGPPQHTDATTELTVAGAGAGAAVLGFVVAALASL